MWSSTGRRSGQSSQKGSAVAQGKILLQMVRLSLVTVAVGCNHVDEDPDERRKAQHPTNRPDRSRAWPRIEYHTEMTLSAMPSWRESSIFSDSSRERRLAPGECPSPHHLKEAMAGRRR